MSNRDSFFDQNRRRVLGGIGGTFASGLVLPSFAGSGWQPRTARRSALFTLGVASGDPRARGVNLWTRLAPDPLNGGGMDDAPVEVTWEVATDPDFRNIVQGGVAMAMPEAGHAVTVSVFGLVPDSVYWYRFSALGETSRTGRTRTFPSFLSSPERMRFALTSCQDYTAGFYAAHRDMADQDLDFVLQVGDYIYEYAADPETPESRRHDGPETVTVEQYRNRYAQYRLDPDLQDAHAAFPWICTWDDHEVDNNYAAGVPEDDQSAEAFDMRRRAAHQVYLETMPMGPRRRIDGDGGLNLFRASAFGDLALLQVLDTRQYRDDQACGDGLVDVDGCPDLLDPARTITGDQQEAWLFDGLNRSRAIWNVIAQQVMFMKWDLGPALGTSGLFNADAWDGYQGARQRVLDFLAARESSNTVVLTGDIHSSWAADLKADFDDPTSATVGAEFVATSISSVFGDENVPLVEATLPGNPHIRFFDGLFRGYVRCEVTREQWRTDFRAVARMDDADFTVPSADLPVSTLASYALNAGEPGLFEV